MSRLASLVLAAAIALGAAAQTPVALTAPDFLELKVKGPLNVDYVHCPDSAGTVLIYAPAQEQLSWVETSPSGRKLTLSLRIPDDVQSVPAGLPRVKVYSSFLSRVENEGDSTLRVLSAADVAEFSAKVIGNGRISVRAINAGKVNGSVHAGRGIIALGGTSTEANYNVNGAGVIQADGLRALDASVMNNGTGSVGVWATRSLSIKGAGSGTVYVLGAPEIKKKTLGVKLQPIE